MRRRLVLVGSGQVEIPLREARLSAILAQVRECEAAGLWPVRLRVDDWVTAADIAARTGRSRERVRQWSMGHCSAGGFPPPLNPGGATCFYSWAEVAPWLGGQGFTVEPPRPELTALNLALHLRFIGSRAARVPDLVQAALGRASRFHRGSRTAAARHSTTGIQNSPAR